MLAWIDREMDWTRLDECLMIPFGARAGFCRTKIVSGCVEEKGYK